MWIDITKRLIFSDNATTLVWEVEQALQNGEDLCEAPFIFGGHFCQWVTARVSIYEYKLLSAHNPSQFASEVARMTADAYELAFQPVDWDGLLCQWMVRTRMPKGLELESAAAVAGGRVSITPVLKMVEHVQFLGELSFSKSAFGSAYG